MKIISTLLSIFFVMLSSLVAQAPDSIWMRTYGGIDIDVAYSVQQTSDGGYIIAGETSIGFNTDVWIIKTDLEGDTLWTKKYGCSGKDIGSSIKQTLDGGYILTGSTKCFGSARVWLIKTDFLGDTLWTKVYQGSSGNSVQQTSDGGYIITGTKWNSYEDEQDLWLAKTDSLGNIIWAKTYGGMEDDIGMSVNQTIDNGYIIAGYTGSFGAGDFDVWLIKTDVFGDSIWTKTFGGTQDDRGNSIQQTFDDGYIIAGHTSSFGLGYPDIWLIKTNSLGDSLWSKNYGGDTWDFGNSVRQTLDSGYVITGSTYSGYDPHLLLIKTDSFGDTLWTKSIIGSGIEEGYAVHHTSDGGYIVAGMTDSYGSGSLDALLVYFGYKTSGEITVYFIPKDYFLDQNYPNPFNPTTTIKYQVPEISFVTIKVYDVLGNEVATLINEEKPAGSYEVEFQSSVGSRQLASGIYYYQLRAGNYVETKKMVLLR